MRNCSELQEQANPLPRSGSWTPPRIRFNPFQFPTIMDSMTKNIRKEALWQTMFANDVALGAREKDVLELELEQWREALEKRGMVETDPWWSPTSTAMGSLVPATHCSFAPIIICAERRSPTAQLDSPFSPCRLCSISPSRKC